MLRDGQQIALTEPLTVLPIKASLLLRAWIADQAVSGNNPVGELARKQTVCRESPTRRPQYCQGDPGAWRRGRNPSPSQSTAVFKRHGAFEQIKYARRATLAIGLRLWQWWPDFCPDLP